MDTPNPSAQADLLRRTGMSDRDIERVARTFNAAAPAFVELAAVGRSSDD
jgi:hypothetical protein